MLPFNKTESSQTHHPRPSGGALIPDAFFKGKRVTKKAKTRARIRRESKWKGLVRVSLRPGRLCGHPGWGKKAVEQRGPVRGLTGHCPPGGVLFAKPLAQGLGLSAVSYCHAGLATEFGMEIVVVVCFTNLATKSLKLEGPMK